MPTYRYRCLSCGNEFDQFQKFNDSPLTDCPSCGQEVRRVIGNVGVVFKGSGWYVTDSRKSQESAARPKNAESSEKRDSADGKAEPKPASSSETKPDAKVPAPA
jgi:putative FmdB family regulatory protein